MISNETNNSYIQPPFFISTLKKEPPEQFTEEAAQRFNYYIQFKSQMSEQIPQLSHAFNFKEYDFDQETNTDNKDENRLPKSPNSNVNDLNFKNTTEKK